jgi:hypothetical protein
MTMRGALLPLPAFQGDPLGKCLTSMLNGKQQGSSSNSEFL